MYPNQFPQLPGLPPRGSWDAFMQRLLGGMAFVHAMLRWISGSLILLTAIIVFFVLLYFAWRGGGEAIDWIDRVFGHDAQAGQAVGRAQ